MAQNAGAFAFPVVEGDNFDRNDPQRRSDMEQLLNGASPQVRISEEKSPLTPAADLLKHDVELRGLLPEKTKKEEFGIHDPPPSDRFNLVYLVLVLHGMGCLMPWNMFITAQSYFVDYKLGGTNTEYAKNFLSYLGICSQLPNVVLNVVNLFIQIKGSLAKRITICLGLNCLICVSTIVLAIIDSSQWPGMFFLITMGTVILLNASNGMYQNSIFGLAADFPSRYSNAVVFGNNVCGTFVSVVNIITMSVSSDPKMAAIYYFIVALMCLLLCFDSYFLLPYCRFFRFYHDQGHRRRVGEQQRVHDKDLAMHKTGCCTSVANVFRPYVVVFKEAWVHMWNIFFIFFVTLTIFPAMQASIEPSTSSGLWFSGRYWVPYTCFLLFNSTAMIGNFVANYIQFPSPKYLWLPVLLRGFMIPYFMFCNYRPALRTWPIYIDNDYAYIGMGILMGLTSGYFSSLAMMYAPRVVDGDKARVAGMMAALFLIVGIFGGVYFTLAVAHINENLGPLVPWVVRNATINGTLPEMF